MLRKMRRQAVETATKGKGPKGVLTEEQEDRIIDFPKLLLKLRV